MRFYYWKYYKTIKELPRKEQWSDNIVDHSNYDVCELYISRKYETLKEEISNYKYILFKQYMDKVVTKANIYMRADVVKEKKARWNGTLRKLHYGIDEGDSLGFNNLLSLILYTDFSSLCKDFSSTFRKTKAYETLSSIKQRNREYYWMSRILRETVEMFGMYYPTDTKGISFYTGISLVMSIPEFKMRLCAPTSTSICIEVAVKFSGVDGMILELQKVGLNQLSTFDCSWLSQYKEESERLKYLYILIIV